MAKLYTNECFSGRAAALLAELGHDVLTTSAAGRAGRGIPDSDVLSYAIGEGRAVVTFNRLDFIHLHRQRGDHLGIIVCTENRDVAALARGVHAAIEAEGGELVGKLLRVSRPQR